LLSLLSLLFSMTLYFVTFITANKWATYVARDDEPWLQGQLFFLF
jgi:hypothetical protein